MSSSRDWMYATRIVDGQLVDKFMNGVREFIDFAYTVGAGTVEDGKISCPCSKCRLLKKEDKYEVMLHLYRRGFMPQYECWFRHGEKLPTEQSPIPRGEEEDGDPIVDMIMDMAGPDYDEFDDNNNEEPHGESEELYELLRKAEEPLWPGCKNYSTLKAVTELLTLKLEHNMTDSCFDAMMLLIKKMLPEDNKLPKNYYETKRMLRKNLLPEVKIDACPNQCCLYYKENENKEECPVCAEPRYRRGLKTRRPQKVLRYFPIAPRLKRLYYCRETAGLMTWHADHTRQDNDMTHPSDTACWRVLKDSFPDFGQEKRNVVIGLSADGFNPHGRGKEYSCWPVMITPYNLPPWLCNKKSFIFLSLLIPGPTHPGKHIDIYLRPLIEELKMLWDTGVDTYDRCERQTFRMRVALLWTINDFPAYGMLSGWSTHGKYSCPYCMEHTKASTLPFSGKPSFFDCHRRFLPAEHPFRRHKYAFKKNKVEHDSPPPRLSGEDLLNQLSHFEQITFGTRAGKQEYEGYGIHHHWTKISIFWELPYWSKLLIRHNLDVMHIEKNVFDNVWNTIMNVKGRTKDHLKARKDLVDWCYRPELNPIFHDDGKISLPKAKYTLDKNQVKSVCEWVYKLKFPDGYASNISNLVNLKNNEFKPFKSHDCHVFMQRLLPLAFRDLLSKPIVDVLTELSKFFRSICASNVTVEDMEVLEENIVIILCNMEKIFPPAFFDSMEHLIIHLPYEAKVGGSVHCRWMYPFERYMFFLKRKVRNKNKVEGSIASQYLFEEVTNFCSRYLDDDVETVHNRLQRNADRGFEPNDAALSVFRSTTSLLGKGKVRQLEQKEKDAIEFYVLDNCDEVASYAEDYRALIVELHPTYNDSQILDTVKKNFVGWFRNHVDQLDPSPKQKRLKELSYGPTFSVVSYGGCIINGYRFRTEATSGAAKTQNWGVMVKGSCYGEDYVDYYGILKEVLEVKYYSTLGEDKVVLFHCDWYDLERGVIIDKKHGIVDVVPKKYIRRFEPFVLATQVDQVMYVPPVSRKRNRNEHLTVLPIKPRAYIAGTNQESDDLAKPMEDAPPYESEYQQPSLVYADDSLDDLHSAIPQSSSMSQYQEYGGLFTEDGCENDTENEEFSAEYSTSEED